MNYEKGNFAVVPNISSLDRLPAGVVRLFLYICQYANKQGQCSPSYNTLSQRTGDSIRQLRRYMQHLEEVGLVEKRYRYTEGRQTSNLYQIKLILSKGGDMGDTLEGDMCDTPGGDTGVLQNYTCMNNTSRNTIYAPTSDKLTVSSGKHTVVEHRQDTPLVKEEKEKYASIPLLIHAMFSHVFELADDTQYMISSYKTVAKEMKHHLAGRGDITIPAMTFIIHLSHMTEYEHLFSWHIQNKKRPRPEQILKWWIEVKKEYTQYTPPTKEEFEQMFSEIGLKMRPEDYDKPY